MEEYVYDVDPANGLEYHTWKGTRMFLCPVRWEGTGVRCAYESHNPEKLREHMTEPHNRTGKHTVVQNPAQREMFVEEPVRPEFGGARFATKG